MTTPSTPQINIHECTHTDITSDFLDTLSHLSKVDLSIEQAREILQERVERQIHTYIAEVEQRIVGTASLLVEQKFIHSGGKVGHIEDVATHRDFGGKGIGKKLIEHLVTEARSMGCYKVILDCSEHNIPFYEKVGFHPHEISMRVDIADSRNTNIDIY